MSLPARASVRGYRRTSWVYRGRATSVRQWLWWITLSDHYVAGLRV